MIGVDAFDFLAFFLGQRASFLILEFGGAAKGSPVTLIKGSSFSGSMKVSLPLLSIVTSLEGFLETSAGNVESMSTSAVSRSTGGRFLFFFKTSSLSFCSFLFFCCCFRSSSSSLASCFLRSASTSLDECLFLDSLGSFGSFMSTTEGDVGLELLLDVVFEKQGVTDESSETL